MRLTGSEAKLSSFIIAVLQLIWAALVTLTDKKLGLMLALYGLREVFSVAMAASSFLILIGCMFPCRKVRHTGLWLTPFICLPTFGILLDNGMVGLSAFVLPFLGAMALVIYFMDSQGKPRHAKVAG